MPEVVPPLRDAVRLIHHEVCQLSIFDHSLQEFSEGLGSTLLRGDIKELCVWLLAVQIIDHSVSFEGLATNTICPDCIFFKNQLFAKWVTPHPR